MKKGNAKKIEVLEHSISARYNGGKKLTTIIENAAAYVRKTNMARVHLWDNDYIFLFNSLTQSGHDVTNGVTIAGAEVLPGGAKK